MLGPNQVDLTLDAGFWQPASIGNYVWVDDNRDGTQDGSEIGVADVAVTLQDAAGEPVTNAAGNPVVPTTTDLNGFYLFPEPPPRYVPGRVLELVGWLCRHAHRCGDQRPDRLRRSDHCGGDGRFGESNLSLDLGIFAPVSVGDFVWRDNNGNGQQDLGEPGIAGVICSISTGAGGAVTDADGNTVGTVATDDLGSYAFTNLMPGQYRVTCATPAGLAPTVADAVTDEADSDGPVAVSQVLRGGQNDATLDFGFVPPSSLGDLVWFDENLNGLQDVGERVVVGVPVELLNPDTRAVLATTTTDAAGMYTFDGLAAGRYLVHFGLPGGGFVVTGHNLGSNDIADSDADRATGLTQVVTLAPGEYPTMTLEQCRHRRWPVSATTTSTTTAHRTRTSRAFPGSPSSSKGSTCGEPRAVGDHDRSGWELPLPEPGPRDLHGGPGAPDQLEDGQDRPGSTGGNGVNDRTTNITLGVGVRSIQNNFGELRLVGTRSGTVTESRWHHHGRQRRVERSGLNGRSDHAADRCGCAVVGAGRDVPSRRPPAVQRD